MNLSIDRLDELLLEAEDRTMASVSSWKKANGCPVIGCFPVYSPVEIIHAGGMLPVGVFGAGTSLEITYADSRFQSFVCSIAKTTLEMGLSGKLEEFDGLFFSSICDVARNLSSVFIRNFPGKYVEYMHVPQDKGTAASLEYFTSELERIRENLEKHFKTSIDRDRIGESIKRYNKVRKVARDLYRIRAMAPENVPSRELFVVMRASTFLPPEAGHKLLASYKSRVEKRRERKKDRIRVIVEGAFCEQPSVEFVATLEEAGCYILDDDFASGWRFLEDDVPESDDPIRALSASALLKCRHTSVRHDSTRPRTGRLIEKVKRLGADAVIFSPAKFCEPALFDYVLYRDALEREGIPHLFLEFEEKMWTFESVRNEVETFVESLLFE